MRRTIVVVLLGAWVALAVAAPVGAKGGEPTLRETTGRTSTTCPDASDDWCTATASADAASRTVQIGGDLRPPLGSPAGTQARASAVLSDTYRMRRIDEVAGRLTLELTRREVATSGTGDTGFAVQFCLRSGDRSSCLVTSLPASELESGPCTVEVDLVLREAGMRSVTFEVDLYGSATLPYGPSRTPPFGSASFDLMGKVSTLPLADVPADPGWSSGSCGQLIS